MNDVVFSNSFSINRFSKGNSTHDALGGSPYHYFAYMLSGECRIVCKDYELRVNEGDIFYIPYGLKYQSHWRQGSGDKIVFYSIGFKYMPNFENHQYPAQVLPFSEKILKIMETMSYGNSPTATDVGLVYTLVGMALPSMKHLKSSKENRTVARVERILLEKPNTSVEDLAKICNMCVASLYLAFSKASRESLREMRERIILTNARQLLITTDDGIEEISDRLGFSSNSYFRKRFKALFGISPREMRKKSSI